MRKIPKNFIYVLVVLIPLLLLMVRPPFFQSQKTVVAQTVSGPMSWVGWPIRELKKIVFYRQTYNDYVKLKQEVDGLKAKTVNAQEIFKENKRLADLVDFKRGLSYPSVVASVIGRDPSNWNAMLIIDKGRVAGIKVGMPVVNPAGVVGKVFEVGDRLSKVILISDPNFNVAALAQDSRESGLLSGTLQGLCRLRYLPEDADIQVGEKVVTSKLSSTFPDGILIGTVISLHHSGTAGTECLVEPVVVPSRIEEVLVLKR